MENQDLWEESDELILFFEAIEALGVSDYVQFAPHIIRGLDYYTGTVFEAQAASQSLRRAILGGGRYDDLLSDVGGDPLPGVGFAMGDMVMLLTLEEFNRLPALENTTPAPVIVTVFDEEHLLSSFLLASDLRKSGLNVNCYPTFDKLGKQFKYADRIGARVALILGPDEMARGEVAIKDLNTREQKSVKRESAQKYIQQILAGDISS
jgi:histidyl-tRNA synthetase